MYRIIFLDDEPITLRMLEDAIDWQKYGISLCGTASDGAEGIALFRQVEPDIVIADIRMPKMDGMEFAHVIRETQKNVKILLLSAYAEFEYAQRALTYQISDYLLKPLDEDKLEAAIARIAHELDREQTVSSTIENYQIEQAEKQLQQLLHRREEDTDASFNVAGDIITTFGQADVLLHILGIADEHKQQTNADIDGIRLFFKDRLGSHAAAVAISPVELIVLTQHSDLDGRLADMLGVLHLREQPVVIGLSSIPEPFDLLHASRQAETALSECFYSGSNLCCYRSEQRFSSDLAVNFAEFEPPIAELVEQGKSGRLNKHLQETLTALFEQQIRPLLLYDFVFDILNWVKIALTKQYPEKTLLEVAAVDKNRLRACATKATLLAYASRYLEAVGAAVSDFLATEPGYYVVQLAKTYARAHYATTDFSLQAAADYVGLSKNHFSRVFHQTTGMKYWDYITQLRIEKAKELLQQSNRPNSEICHEIGYKSEFYFSKIFKRVVGIAAQEFRRL